MDEETRRIGRYATRRVLGNGAFATVWLARDEELDVPVAIKVLADNWAHNADVRGRFVDEARLLRRISDPRVVGVHDIGTLPDGRSYFVMDFADGGTVANLVGGIDRRTALELTVETARAVQVLHDQQILHRDVKPSNLLLRRRERRPDQLMIADLGTAKALAEASGLTVSAGTPAYMAPEQAHGAAPLSIQSDVYGIAAVGYALIAGEAPFRDERTVTDVATRSPGRRPDPVDGGSALDRLFVEALAFDPDRRPASALELIERLEQIVAPSTSTSTSTSSTAAPTVVLSRPARSPATPVTPVTPVSPGVVDSPADARSTTDRTESVSTEAGSSPAARAGGDWSNGAVIGLALAAFVASALLVWLLTGLLGS